MPENFENNLQSDEQTPLREPSSELDAAKERLERFLSQGMLYVREPEEFQQAAEGLNDEAIAEIAGKIVLEFVRQDQMHDALSIKSHFNVPNTPLLKQLAREVAIKRLDETHVEQAGEIIDAFSVAIDDEMSKRVQDTFVKSLSEGWLHISIEIAEKFKISEDTLRLPSAQEAAKLHICKLLKAGVEEEEEEDLWGDSPRRQRVTVDHAEQAIKLAKIFSGTSVISAPEVEAEARASISESIRDSNFERMDKLAQAFNISGNTLLNLAWSELQKAFRTGYHSAAEIGKRFNFAHEDVVPLALGAILEDIKTGGVTNALAIRRSFHITNEELKTPEIRGALLARLRTFLINTAKFTVINDFQANFPIPDDVWSSAEVQEAVEDWTAHALRNNMEGEALKAREVFHLPEPKFWELVREEAENFVKGKDYGHLNRLLLHLPVPFSNRLIESENLRSAAESSILKFIQEGHYEGAIKVRAQFKVGKTIDEVTEGKVESLMNDSLHPTHDSAIGLVGLLAQKEIQEKIPKTIAELRKVVIENINRGAVIVAVSTHLNNIYELPAEVAYALASKGFAEKTTEFVHHFINIDQKKLLDSIISYGDLTKATDYNESIGSPDRDLVTCRDIFGDSIRKETYELIQRLRSGDMPLEARHSLGVRDTGEAGIVQLRERIAKFKGEIYSSDFDPHVLRQSETLAQFFRKYVRYEESEWGEHDENFFERTIDKYVDLKDEGELRPLPEEFKESGEVKIAKISKKAQEEFKYSEQFLNRYNTLRDSFEEALGGFEQKKPLTQISEEAEAKSKILLESLRNRLNEQTNPRAKENLSKKINQLEDINWRSVRDFPKTFTVLSQFSEFNEELRKLVFFYAISNPTHERMMRGKLLKADQPSLEDVSTMINFVSHIVNEETWSKYFTDRNAKKAFETLTNIRALEEELARVQNQAIKGTTNMDFVPTRGILLEFSGHIADACWASHYESIANEFPNFSSVIMVQNKGTKHERLAGACLLIETETAREQTPLLIIRGLNPIENVINELSVEDFYNKFVAYAKGIAEASKRKLAIVIDDHAGGSGTNRPALFSHLNKIKSSLRPVRLRNPGECEFNGYDISGNTYLVE